MGLTRVGTQQSLWFSSAARTEFFVCEQISHGTTRAFLSHLSPLVHKGVSRTIWLWLEVISMPFY
jgi:hypothetical protein